MISIVVCSVKPALLVQFKENVAATIGVDYEIIAIDNRQSSNGICRVYNNGFKATINNIVCFCHEDIYFETENWGAELVKLLKDPSIGIAGSAGAIYKSVYPNPWISVPREYYRTNMVQHKPGGARIFNPVLEPGLFSEVAVVDGFFIAGTAAVFNKYQWNETLLPNFHLYDIDISIRVGRYLKVVVCNTIKVAHLSQGSFDNNWLRESEKFHSFYKDELPIRKLVDSVTHKRLDYYSLLSHINRLIILKQPKIKILKYYFRAQLFYPFKMANFSVLKRLLST
jgi:glycosyltransferase involved in cell wall biosynthesis